MKNLIIIMLVLFVTSCKKEEVKAPAPAPPPPPSSLTTAELALVGHWNMVLIESYYADTLAASATYNDSINCKIDFYDIDYPYSTLGWHDAVGGKDCTNAEFGWKISGVYLMIQGIYYQIITQTSTSLIIQEGTTSTGAFRYYYTK